MRRRLLLLLLLATPLATSGPFVATAEACPMCKQANETDDEAAAIRPQAYMYSILFMLSMPLVLFGGFGLVVYRSIKKSERELAERDAAEGAFDGTDSSGLVPQA